MAQLVNPENKNSSDGFNPNVDNSNQAVAPNTFGKVLTYASFIFIIPIFMYIGTRNNLVRLQAKINESASGIDVQLRKRSDTLNKLVDAVKGSMKFESSLLHDITSLRSPSSAGINPDNIVAADRQLSNISGRILATFEAYPAIKSTEAVASLMASVDTIEQEIGATRRLYNAYVTEFNTRIFTWPGSVIAGAMQLRKLPLFAASDTEKKDVKIDFNV